MAKRKKQSKNLARVIFALLGFGLLLWNANTIGLYLLGNVAPAYDISLSRIGTRDDTNVGTKYRFSASYKYVVDGVEYEGLDTGLRGPRLGPKYDHTVHYYHFAPRISSLFAESAISSGMVITCGFSLVLILIAVIQRKGGRNTMFGKRKCEYEPEQERVTMAWLMEHTDGYDDRLEEYYQNGWDDGDPSWECSCSKWNTENFCENCGNRRYGAAKNNP